MYDNNKDLKITLNNVVKKDSEYTEYSFNSGDERNVASSSGSGKV